MTTMMTLSSFTAMLLCLQLQGLPAAFSASLTASLPQTAPNKLVSIPLIPHAVQRRRLQQEHGYAPDELVTDRPHSYDARRRQLQGDGSSDPTPVSELFQGYGTHYADLWCGTPPQRATVIVDTGSGVTAFPCSDCHDCGVPKYHSDGLFEEDLSASFHKLECQECLRGHCRDNQCSISMSYAEGSSWAAFEALDDCYVGGLHSETIKDDLATDALDPFHAPAFTFGLKFGCQTHLTGLFITQLADGIMGMDNAKAAYWKQMYDAGTITREAFSLCFSRHDQVTRQGTESGSMTLGGTDPRLHSQDMVFVDTNMGNGFYGVKLRNIYLREGGGGDSALSSVASKKVRSLNAGADAFAHGQFIVDSGTTDTYFARAFGPFFKSLFKEMTGIDYSHSKVKLTQDDLNALPTILFQLYGNEALNQPLVDQRKGKKVVGLAQDVDPDHPLDVIIAMPPSHYMEYDTDSEAYVARFYLDEGSGGVLGANAMMGHDVYFDVTDGQIGWAESNCDYTKLMEKYYPNFDSHNEATPGTKGDDDDDDGYTDDYADDDDNGTDDDTNTDGLIVDDDHEEFELPDSEFCSSTSCQASFVAVVVITVIVVAFRMLRKTDVEYELANGAGVNGLELKVSGQGDYGYRDDTPGGGYQDDRELSEKEIS